MDSFMTNSEIQQKINEHVRSIAYKVFSKKGDYKFVSAYEKLYSRLLLDWGIHINNRIKDSHNDNATMFDVLVGNEFKMALRSCEALQKMYADVMDRKAS